MSTKKQKHYFKCPICNGSGTIQIGNRYMEADIDCNFRFCRDGEVVLKIETSPKKARKVLDALVIMHINSN